MNISSAEIINSVAAELKHYIEVQRREEGFDLSGPYEPRKMYPKLKVESTINYGKLHDRNLKHYFTPSMIKTHIANLDALEPGSPREKIVRRQIKKRMKKYSDKNQPSISQELIEELHLAQLEALNILHAESQKRLRRRVIRGTPVLRRATCPKITRGEAVRLVNRSSQILVATETVALAHEILSQRHNLSSRPQSAPSPWLTGLPNLYFSPERPKTARGSRRSHGPIYSTPQNQKRKPRYVWDINGRKVPTVFQGDVYDHHFSSISCSDASSSVEINSLNKLQKGQYRPVRPMSAVALPHRMHVGNYDRPHSADVMEPTQHLSAPISSLRKTISPDSGFSIDAETQTRTRRKYSGKSKQVLVSESERDSEDVQLCKYRVEIRTGDRLGAGTTADIYLSLHGDEGETDEIYLTHLITNEKKRKPFKRAQVDIFEIEAENVGELQKIGIGHDQKKKGYSWFVDYVIIQLETKSWKFHCKSWLSGSFSKKKTFRHIAINHISSESSINSSDSVSSSSDDVDIVEKTEMKVLHRQSSLTSLSSTLSSKSSHFQHSKSSSSSAKSQTNFPPVFSVQPPTPLSSSHTFEIRASSRASSKESKSPIEYSSDSTVGGGNAFEKEESFVEESEDTRGKLSSSSDSETLTDKSKDEEDLTTKATDKTDTSLQYKPFSVDDFFDKKVESLDRYPSFSNRHSSEKSIETNNKTENVEEERELSHSDTASSPKSDIQSERKILEITTSLVTEDNSSISSSSPDDVNSSIAEGIFLQSPRVSLAEAIPLQLELSNNLNSFDDIAEVTERTQANVEETTEEIEQEVIKADEIEADVEIKISDTQGYAEDISSRRSSSSSSSDGKEPKSDENVDNHEVQYTEDHSNIYKEESAVVVSDETADVSQSEKSRKTSLTDPHFMDPEEPEPYEIAESLQSDEEGIVQAPTSPTIRTDVHNLIKEEETEKVVEILTLRPELKEKLNEKGWSPIHMAATHGKLEILQWLAATGANLKAETATGYTPMHMAAMHGHVQCTTVLYSMGADINARNVDNQTPLHLASMSGHLEMVKWLVESRADIEAQDISGRTALDFSKQYHHHEVSQLLKNRSKELKKEHSSTSLMESSKSSMGSEKHSSSSSSSSSDEERSLETQEVDLEEVDRDKINEMVAHEQLEEKKRMYERQQRKMVRRRSSFLDMIRSEAEDDNPGTSSTSSESEAKQRSSTSSND